MPADEKYNWILQKCPICEIPPQTMLGKRGGAAHRAGLGVECDIWRCDQCGLIFPNPMPVPVNGLEQHYGLDPMQYFEHHEAAEKDSAGKKLLTQAESLIGSKGRLLDIGAGRGELLRLAKLAGWDAVGIELSPTFAEYAARHSESEIVRRPVAECNFPNDSFDVVVLSAVLEHLYNPDETISEIARILKPGGALFLDVPNEAGLYFRLGNFYQTLRGRNWVVNLAPTFPPFHVFGFTPYALRKLLSKHGFEVRNWTVYAGQSLVPAHGGLIGRLEQQAAHLVTSISRLGELGAYIEAWAVKSS